MSQAGDNIRTLIANYEGELKQADVVTITAKYSGSGDEGNFEVPEAWNTEGAAITLPDDFAEELEPLLDEVVEELHDGYENNEGGGGEVTITVWSGKIWHEGYDYITSTEDRGTAEV